MSIEIIEVTEKQEDQILQSGESHFLDLKSIDVTPSKLSRSIAAFANSAGGELYIGIDESDDSGIKVRHWRGFPSVEAANGHLQAFEQRFPLGQYYSHTFLSSRRYFGLVLQVTIHKSSNVATSTDGAVYVRRGAQNLPITNPEALTQLRRDKGIESFELETISADIEFITNSPAMTEFVRNVLPTTTPETWLKKQQLIKHDKPTVAGILLFAEEPQAFLPKHCGVKIYRFGTSAQEGTRDTLIFDPVTIEGHLYEQIRLSVARTNQIIEDIPRMGKSTLESITYPEETLHEIITNALLHRDYSRASDVHIRIFDNRVEIESPGTLPGHVTVSNILREQFARNGTLVRIINKFPNPPNKDIGEGLNTAFLAMSKLRLQPPEIKETENSVVVYIKHERLASPEAAIMEYLETHGEITNTIGRQLTGISSETTIKFAFRRLRDKGLIELIPGRPYHQSAWRKIKRNF